MMKFEILFMFVMVCVLSNHKSSCCQTRTKTITTSTTREGILIAGGYGPSTPISTELFIPDTGKSCNLPDLPVEKDDITLDTLDNTPVLCGDGYGCLQFTPLSTSGVWTHFASTVMSRSEHVSWVSSAGLVLMGGGWDTTAEVVGVGRNFSLVQITKATCAIPDKDSVIITGGEDTLKVVARYNLQGHVENLPELTQGRYSHGCGSYHNSGGTMVLVVAGGWDEGYKNHLSSTEQLTMGATAWTTAKSLPRALGGVATVSMNNKIYLLGGLYAPTNPPVERAEILVFDEEDWKEVGQLQRARFGHAATKITTFLNCN